MENSKTQELFFQDPKDSKEGTPVGAGGVVELLREPEHREPPTKEAAENLLAVPRSPKPLEGRDGPVKSSSQPAKEEGRPRWYRTAPRFECPVCRKTFPWQSALARHQLSHSRAEPYQCPDCPRSFAQRAELARHRRLHTGELPSEGPDRGKHFCDCDKLARHRKSHAGKRPFQCGVCSRGFSLSSSLRRHQRVHTGEGPPHGCPECGRSFSRRSNLLQHLRVHRPQGPQQNGEQGAEPQPGDSDHCEEEWEYEWVADTQDWEEPSGPHVGNREAGPVPEPSAGEGDGEVILELRIGDYEHGWATEIDRGDPVLEGGMGSPGNREHPPYLVHSSENPESRGMAQPHVRGWNTEFESEEDDCLLIGEEKARPPDIPEPCLGSDALSADQGLSAGNKPPQWNCGQMLTRSSTLSRHQLPRSVAHPCACAGELCCRSFRMPSLLGQRGLTPAPGQPLACPECPKHFSHRSKWLRHQLVHTGQRPFQCKECGKSYRDHSTLVRHGRTHDKP